MGKKGYEIKNRKIIINRELTKLDLFVRDFIDILEKHSNYLVVSGFVSISTGRTRGTEDIDILVPFMTEQKFNELFKDLQKNKFWCYQGDEPKEVYPYIKNMHNIRFARIGEMFPNIEFIPVTPSRKAQFFELNNPQKIKIKDFEFQIPPIEFEIVYKELVLGSSKDIDDAKHLKTFFSDILDGKKFEECKKIIESRQNEETQPT